MKIAPAATSPTANKFDVSRPPNKSLIPLPLNSPFNEVKGMFRKGTVNVNPSYEIKVKIKLDILYNIRNCKILRKIS